MGFFCLFAPDGSSQHLLAVIAWPLPHLEVPAYIACIAHLLEMGQNSGSLFKLGEVEGKWECSVSG